VDAVIARRQTRPRLIRALRRLEAKRDKNPPKKHGNTPLRARPRARGAATWTR
jgi:propionyl-CoA carboxylase beta chain